MSFLDKDKKYLGREGVARPLVVAKTKGPFVYDEKGERYIDFFMGWCVGNVGWNTSEVSGRVKKFNGPTYVSPRFLYRRWADLAGLLAQITPGRLTKSFRATGGTEAVEISLQAAMIYTKRRKFISVEGAYHGHSIAAMSIGSSEFRGWYKDLLPHCYKVKPPLDERAARKVEKILTRRDIAAFISEPIICNAGVIIPDQKFFSIIQAACKKYGTLFIMDEVATGFGRTGKMFASEHYGLKPDIMVLAKGITNGYGVLGAAIMTPEVARSFEFPFSFYSTFGWQPLNTEAAIANIEYLIKNKKKLLENANRLSRYFEDGLRKIRFKYPPEIRVKGLAIGVAFRKSSYASEIIARCQKSGLLIADATPKDFIIFPPLDMDSEIAQKGLDILGRCIK